MNFPVNISQKIVMAWDHIYFLRANGWKSDDNGAVVVKCIKTEYEVAITAKQLCNNNKYMPMAIVHLEDKDMIDAA